MKPPDKRKLEEFKKQFQTSNFSANEYMKWKRSGQTEIEREPEPENLHGIPIIRTRQG